MDKRYRLDKSTHLVLTESETLTGIAARHPDLPTAIPSIVEEGMSVRDKVVEKRWLVAVRGTVPTWEPWTPPLDQVPPGWLVEEQRVRLPTGHVEERAVLAREMDMTARVVLSLDAGARMACFHATAPKPPLVRRGQLYLIFVPMSNTPRICEPFREGLAKLRLPNSAVGFLTVAYKIDAAYALGTDQVWPITQGIEALPPPRVTPQERRWVSQSLNSVQELIAPQGALDFLERARKAQARIAPATWPADRPAAVGQYRAWLLQWAITQLSDKERARRGRYLYLTSAVP